MRATAITILILSILAACCSLCYAQIGIDSVIASPSTCANNGNLTIFAHSNNTPLLYSITDGPVTVPAQSSNTFNSLPPGVYQLLITNFGNDTAMRFAAVYGNYTYPEFTTAFNPPTCSSSADGRIVATPTPQTGCPPFTWILTNNQTGQVTTQASRVFTGLAHGSYTISLTDTCLNSTTQTVTIPNNNTGIESAMLSYYTIHDCYNTTITFNVRQLDNSPLLTPLTIRVSTKNGTYTSTPNLNGDQITETVTGAGFADTVNITVTNNCGDKHTYTHYITPFEFIPSVVTLPVNCNAQATTASVGIYGNTVIAIPLNYTLRDSATGAVVESGTVRDTRTISFASHIGNRAYTYTVTDSCGNSYSGHFFWPAVSIPPPSVSYYTTAPHCLDSSATAIIAPHNFTGTPVMKILSGPTPIGSSKTGYSYTDNNIYNQPISLLGGAFSVYNLGAGTYQYEVRDNCGNYVRDSFTITPAMIGDDNYSLEYIKGCPGQNKLICNFFTRADTTALSMAMGNYTIQNLTTGNIAANQAYFYYNSTTVPLRTDTIRNLDAGTYLITIQYQSNFGGTQGHFPAQTHQCWLIMDTLIIPPYQRPRIQNAIRISCHGNSFVELQADSTYGIAPYTYEIIAGPQTVPAQSSNTFVLNTTGTYLARITDACGTANTTSFSVDTATFPPIGKFGSSCTGGTTLLTYQHSPYLTYRWRKPNGTIYTGDTLILSPTTLTDTGTYIVTKIVSVNGCIDSFTASYNLQQNAMHYRFDTICHGSSYTFGGHTYYSTGIYTDTILTTGCDSIVLLNLQVLYQYDTIQRTLCPQQVFNLNGKNYSSAGLHYDTLTGTGCDTILVIDLHYNSYSYGSQLVTNCPGSNYVWNGRPYNQAGIYRDTLATTGCDSIDILYLDVPEILHEVYYDTICSGETYRFGAHNYGYTGVYNDTVPFARCYKTRELNLYVAEPPTGDTAEQNYTVQFYDSVTLTACIPGLTYRWSHGECPGCSTVTLKPTEEYNYYRCQAINEYGCIATCYYTVMIEGVYGNVFMPNAFTPNNDGNNDVFKLFGKNIRFHSLQVFNRLGEKVFDTENENNGWDGTYKGEPQPPGVYIYMVKYSPLYNAESRNIKGSVTLLR